MVEPVGIKAVVSSTLRPGAVVASTPRVQAPAQPADRATVTLAMADTMREMAAKPPVDADRVAQIRRAIKDGNFPITPATIADRMLALKLNWRPDDTA